MIRKYLAFGLLFIAAPTMAQQIIPRALDNYAVTSGAVTALTGPANGCNITSAVDLIIDLVGTAGTSTSTTSQKQPANGSPFQCGSLGPGVKLSVNCSGGGTCSWAGYRW
jgi:hypothetical protein